MSNSLNLPFEVTICGIDELVDHSAAGVSHVLSILDPARAEPEAFGSFGEHARLELRFLDVLDDRPESEPPQSHHIEALLAFGREMMSEPAGARHLLVHCHAGVSRSTAATLLLLAQARPDRPAGELMAEVARVRSKAWPNLRMVELGDAMLGRGGTLVAAARARYRFMAEQRPELVRLMSGLGRDRELEGIPREG
ncbi:MAG TPA: protein-tyrosine-phosphatase [Aliidongia sp.]|nr:protein-tyrosine-phosphatase [Aliidongia sp.]